MRMMDDSFVASRRRSRDETMVRAPTAARIAGISSQRLWYWEKTNLVGPAVVRRISERNIVRLYSLAASAFP